MPRSSSCSASGLRWATTALAVVAAGVLVLGTLVTAAGPHAGDPGTERLGLDIRLMAIAHADAVWLLVGLTVALVAVTWRHGPPELRTAVRALLVLELLQGTLGYTQYALGIPAGLVAIHILGAALVWAAAVAVWVRARPPAAP
jgi:heme a synthase